jgi:hypothetical protein
MCKVCKIKKSHHCIARLFAFLVNSFFNHFANLKKNYTFVKKIEMKILVNVEDTRANFLLELLASLSFVTIETQIEDISEEHKRILDKRLAEYEQNPNNLISWEHVQSQLHKTAV